MKLRQIVAIAVVLLVSLVWGCAQELPMTDVSYTEGFENGDDPVKKWVANGEYEVNFKGVTDERAFEGEHCFKLDVTLKSGSYFYWHVPVRFPAEGELKFSGRISTGEEHNARVNLGVNWIYPPTRHSGVGTFGTVEEPMQDWKLIEADVAAGGEQNAQGIMTRWVAGAEGEHVGRYVDRWGIFIKGKPGQRAVIYIDDIRFEGRVPEDEAYQDEFARRWDNFEEDWDARIAQWRDTLAEGREAMQDVPELPERVAPAAESARGALDRAATMIDEMAETGYAHPRDVDELEAKLRMARLAPQTVQHIAEALEGDAMVATFIVPAMTNARILPTETVIPGEPGAPLEVAACAGEYESGSFVLLPLADVEDVQVAASDLTSDGGTIPADAVDVKYLKVWYQAGRGIRDLDNKQLVPELLLNDPELVRVDTEEEHNYLRSTAPDGTHSYVLASDPDPATKELEGVRPIDADTLQPIDLPTLRLQQYWVTVHVPDDAAPGDYEGALTISSEGNPDVQVPVELTVHGFDLEPAPLTYSVYYRAKLHESNEPTITSERRSEEQYLAEMRDMKSHSVLYPTLYQGYHEELLPRALELREEAGLPKERLFSLGISTGAPKGDEAIEKLRERVRKWLAMTERFGYEDLYIYGIDEAKGDRLAAQRRAWKAVQEEGAHTFVACYYGTFEAMGDLLDVAVLAHRPDPEEAAKFHGVGSEVFTYAFPQVGPEEAETFRRNFGLVLWQADFDGAMDYAYQHGFGHVWNDFDSDRYRDHNFTYPTVNGVVDTVQWAGLREASDDTRYMATLQAAIEASDDADAKAAAQKWIDELDPQRDLYEVRAEMVQHINTLLGAP